MSEACFSSGRAFSPDEVRARLARACVGSSPGKLAVGVSGGPDSMGACLALASADIEMHALIVDHGLRAGSDDEAGRVAGWLDARGIGREILRWQGDKPATGIHEAARTARLALMAGAARAAGCAHLALAHHMQDQAETVLLRMAKGSGPDGLAGMALARTGPHGIRIIRPFLADCRERLKAICKAAGQEFITDPSNADPRFARARLRHVEQALGNEGLDARALCLTARKCGEARAALERATVALIDAIVDETAQGLVIDRAGLESADPEIATRLLARALGHVGQLERPARTEIVDGVARWFSETATGRMTAAHCLIEASAGEVTIRPENRPDRQDAKRAQEAIPLRPEIFLPA